MTQKDIKKRDVWAFDEFAKAYEKSKELVMLKKGQNADPGAHAIEGEPLYSRNDANPYIAAGIPLKDEKTANISNYSNANQVDVYDTKHDGKEKMNQPVAIPNPKASKEVANIIATGASAGIVIDESEKKA